MRHYLASALLITPMSISSALADWQTAGELALVSEYIDRGEPQGQGEAALQAGLELDSGFGPYVGLWGATVNFDDAELEADAYAGWRHELAGIGLDLGYYRYTYPHSRADNVEEIYLGLEHNGFSLTLAKGLDEAEDNLELGYSHDFSQFTLELTAGAHRHTNDYYMARLSRDFGPLDAHLAVIANRPETGDDREFLLGGVGYAF